MSRRTKAEIEADALADQAFHALHARAAAEHVRANPDVVYNVRYLALAQEAEQHERAPG